MPSTNNQVVEDLFYQALETEIGGEAVYETALECVKNADLKKEWKKYLAETRTHQKILTGVLQAAGLDPELRTPGREVVKTIGDALVAAMKKAQAAGDPAAAEIVAGECVVLAETKDHMNWDLLKQLSETNKKYEKLLVEAVEEVHSQEAHHLFHSKGWTRELWIQALGLPAVLPPPEEVKKVETAIGASRAEQARDQMLSSS